MRKTQSTAELLEDILSTHICTSHADVQKHLATKGRELTQASVSRALNRLGAIKARMPNGTIAYRLHKGTVHYRAQSGKITRQAIIHHMAERIIGNGAVFVILGKPDSGRYLGTFVDDAALPSVAGTIAGGNTLLVVPSSIKNIATTARDLQTLFPDTPLTLNN